MVSSIPYTRGMFYLHPEWSKDTSPKFFETRAMRYGWTLVKIALLLNLYLILHKTLGIGHLACLVVCIIVTLYFQEVTARVYGLKRIPSMD